MRPITAVDRLLAAYNVALAGVWLAWAGRAPGAVALAAAHIAGALLPWLLLRTSRLPRPAALLRDFYPLVWLAAFWSEVDIIRRTMHVAARDGAIRSLDLAIFGVHLHEIALPALPWISEPLHFVYFAYYATIVVPIVVLYYQGRRMEQLEALFRLLATYTACFIVYIVFPVDGPAHAGTAYRGPAETGLFFGLVHLVNGAGSSLGAAFPSSHVAGAVTIAFIGRSWFSRKVATLLTVQAAGVLLATFYTQYHYAADSVAGLVLALVLQGLVVPRVLRAGVDRAACPLELRPPHALADAFRTGGGEP